MKIVSIIAAPPGWRTAHYDHTTKEVFYSIVGAWALVETGAHGGTEQQVRPLIAFPDSDELEVLPLNEAPIPRLVPPGHEATHTEKHGLSVHEVAA